MGSRVRILYVPENEIRRSSMKLLADPTLEYEVDFSLDLESNIERICQLCRTPERPSKYALLIREKRVYLTNSEPLSTQLEGLVEPVLVLILKPSLRAAQCIENLLQSPESATVKENIFYMRYELQDPGFAEEFIAQGGMEKMLNVILHAEGSSQAYALTALRCFMGYYSGLNEFLEAPELIEKLFYLVGPSSIAPVCRQALELLFVVCNYDGWRLVHWAAKFTARARGMEPYSNVIPLLESGDVDTQVNTLTLLNSLLDNAPDDTKVEKLLNCWKDLGIFDILKRQKKIKTSEFKTQLEMFEVNAGRLANDGSIASQTTRRSYKDMVELVKQYEEQQPLIRLLYAELRYYQNAIRSAINNGAYITRGPLERSEQRGDDIRPVSGPVDLSYLAKLKERKLVHSGSYSDLFERRLFRRTMLINDLTKEHGIGATLPPSAPSATTTAAAAATGETAGAAAAGGANHSPAASAASPATTGSSAAPPAGDSASDQVKPVATVADDDSEVPPPLPPAPHAAVSRSQSGTDLNALRKGSQPAGIEAGKPKSIVLAGSALEGAKKDGDEPGGADGDGAATGPSAPPPPLPAGLPPPPPAKGAKPSKTAIKPKRKLKPLHWKRFVAPPKNDKNRKETIWDWVKELPYDGEQLEEMFCVQPPKKKKKEEGKEKGGDDDEAGEAAGAAATPTGRQPAVRVLSSKRSNAVAIMMTKLPPSFEVLAKAIREVDNTVLTRENISSLLFNFPTAEELSMIQEVYVPGVLLDKPEQFCLQLNSIPKLKLRLRCWDFVLGFNERLDDISPPLLTIQKACKQVRRSPALQKVLGLILAIGNHLNGGNPQRGQADGFNIDVIPKLTETKDVANRLSLLEYIIRLLRKDHPDALELPEELSAVEPASKITLKDVASALKKLANDLRDVQASCVEITSSTDHNDPFLKTIPEALDRAKDKLAALEKEFTATENMFLDLIVYFGASESSEIANTEKFFGTFADLVLRFKRYTAAKKTPAGGSHPPGAVRAMQKPGAKIGDSSAEDPMANIIAAIRAGKTAKLPKPAGSPAATQ